MKIMKAKISLAVLVAMLIISGATFAQKPKGTNNKKEVRETMKPGTKSDGPRADFLTEEQKETMKKLRLETAHELKPLKNELRELMAHQQTLVTADKADLNAINKNIDKMGSIKTEMAKVLAKQHQAFRSQLTEEQLLKFDGSKTVMKNKYHGKRTKAGREQNYRRGA